MAGKKPEAFTKVENDAMRARLVELQQRNKWSQRETGMQLGVGQQAASVLLKAGGFSRPTALGLAHICGFDSPEALLAVLLAPKKEPGEKHMPTTSWFERDIAFRSARNVGVPEVVLERVAAKHSAKHHSFQRPLWWAKWIMRENEAYEQELKDLKEHGPESSHSLETEPVATPPKKRPRTA